MMKRCPKPEPAKSWWSFTGDGEVFEARNPDRISRLYFPLCNEAGLLSAITPTLHGDIKTGQNSFVTLPVSVEDLHNTRSNRQFWICTEKQGPWGVASAAEDTRLSAGALWHRIERTNRRMNLKADILNFIPAGPETVEIMQVTVTNTGRAPVTMTPTAAIPLYARSADNLRDHRHVTSLLHRIHLHDHGVLVTPTMSFDERGHKLNSIVYAVLGAEASGAAPVGSFPTVASWIGEGGSFDAPRAVLEDLDPPDLEPVELQGREAVGALRFRSKKLAPGKSATWIVLIGQAAERKEALGWLKAYGTAEKVEEALAHTKSFWRERLDRFSIETGDADFGRWVRWVTIQPVLREIFGCSFLPDFDYGRGGRGWRDLWQDCLALLLMDCGQPMSPLPRSSAGEGIGALAPKGEGRIRSLLLNNFAGVRISGTNATIIGKAPGEFIADRNHISRTWMDHGVWPWMTSELYLHQTGDLSFLLEEVPYFWDQDKVPAQKGGSVLEHILIQHLTAYFNVGEHGTCRLEDADWNDGLDMAHERGESVAFTAMYAGNLQRLADTILKLRDENVLREIHLPEEWDVLLESKASSVHLAPSARRERLGAYRVRCAAGFSGKKIHLSAEAIARDLKLKGDALAGHLREHEWVKASSGHAWFNGYYDNQSRRVEGETEAGVRMTLTGQVFPILSGVATNEQVQQCFAAAKRYLFDKKLGGFRLNTDFGGIQPDLGRAFSFAYGEKENGAFFSHMIVMFANALYRRGFVEEGHEVLSSLYRMCRDAERSNIYPGLPEYCNGEGRGLYHYLTGSASWYLLTLATEVLGVCGRWGDLVLSPKLVGEQFGSSGQVSAVIGFAGKKFKICYINRSKKTFGQYQISSVLLQGKSLPMTGTAATEILIPRKTLEALTSPVLELTVSLT